MAVKMSSTTTGSGNLTVASVSGFEDPDSLFGTGSGNQFGYRVFHLNGVEWESGIGYMSSGSVFVRSTVIESSNSDNTQVDLSAGMKYLILDAVADDAQFDTIESNGNVTVGGALAVTGATTFTGDATVTADLIKSGENGSTISLLHVTGTHTTNSGAGTETISGVVPTGAVVQGVCLIVTSVISGSGLSDFSVGDGTDADLYGTGIALDADTTVGPDDWTASPTTHAFPAGADGDIVLTGDAGQFDAGQVRYVIYYTLCVAPTA